MNVIGYIRVSSLKQVDEGLGLEVQEESIRRWCEAEGHALIGLHRDEGVSGAKESADRPGLGKALVAVEDTAEALVVYRLDRLARHLVIQETIIERLGKLGRTVLSVSEPDIDDGDPTRVLIRQVLGSISQYERSVIAARMMAGRRAKHTRGGYAGFGSPPMGWKSDGKDLVADPAEQKAIARIVELRGQGKSLREIGSTLMVEGLAPKRGDRWHPKTVSRVLQRVDAQKEASAAAEVLRRQAEDARREAIVGREQLRLVRGEMPRTA